MRWKYYLAAGLFAAGLAALTVRAESGDSPPAPAGISAVPAGANVLQAGENSADSGAVTPSTAAADAISPFAESLPPLLEDQPRTPAPAPSFRDPPWQEMRSEIMQIRKAVGIDPLAGTALETLALPEGENFFEQGLDQAADDRQNQAVARFSGPGALPQETAALDPNYAVSLRTTIAMMLARAERLEADRQFEASDRLRRLARGLRHEARLAEGWRPADSH
ncbi:hypothetical protein [Lignipirellula cremea]|uniref:Uncharacterized protein n=1 Tax=Lignipirellula cremea TaxID=2528010 RepID=A0A518DMK1_9BACT|nr:hypothetical protein [Lignipirellula cremea]QDU93067.1 hypothetical protein Pla8534_08440 [Lignipirellula cremea]